MGEAPFQIIRELGAGGMGQVFEVTLPGDPRPHVAKLLTAVGEVAQERFRREGEVVARLDDHPGIVRVGSMGVLDSGTPYLVFERVEGLSLTDRIEKGDITVEEALRIACELSSALAHAHARGVVHRDVKPDNIILDPTGAVRLLDFGLALAADVARLTDTRFTVGTPLYMACEQIAGSEQEQGPWTDVHAVGLVLYECLVGASPFSGREPMILMAQVVSSVPRPVSAHRSDVGPGLDAIVARCLEKEASDRYPDCGALLADLETFARGEPPQALGMARARRAKRALVGVAAAVALLLSLIGAQRWLTSRRAGPGSADTTALVALEQARRSLERGALAAARDGLRDVEAQTQNATNPALSRSIRLLQADVHVADDAARAVAVYRSLDPEGATPSLGLRRALVSLSDDPSRVPVGLRAALRAPDPSTPSTLLLALAKALAESDPALGLVALEGAEAGELLSRELRLRVLAQRASLLLGLSRSDDAQAVIKELEAAKAPSELLAPVLDARYRACLPGDFVGLRQAAQHGPVRDVALAEEVARAWVEKAQRDLLVHGHTDAWFEAISELAPNRSGGAALTHLEEYVRTTREAVKAAPQIDLAAFGRPAWVLRLALVRGIKLDGQGGSSAATTHQLTMRLLALSPDDASLLTATALSVGDRLPEKALPLIDRALAALDCAAATAGPKSRTARDVVVARRARVLTALGRSDEARAFLELEAQSERAGPRAVLAHALHVEETGPPESLAHLRKLLAAHLDEAARWGIPNKVPADPLREALDAFLDRTGPGR